MDCCSTLTESLTVECCHLAPLRSRSVNDPVGIDRQVKNGESNDTHLRVPQAFCYGLRARFRNSFDSKLLGAWRTVNSAKSTRCRSSVQIHPAQVASSLHQAYTG